MARILLIDDYKISRDLYQNLIEKSGYSVDTAIDGKEGLDKASKDKYDLILVDQILPNMSSMEIVKSLKDNLSISPDQIAVLFTLGNEPQLQPFRDLGLNNFILKSTTDHQRVLLEIINLINLKK